MSLNTLNNNHALGQDESPEDQLGDSHLGNIMDNPLRPDAFVKSDDEKIQIIEEHFRHIMDALGLDLTDDSLRGTPKRVAKAFVKEMFAGLHPDRLPGMSTFDNKYKYGEMLVEKNIIVYSTCEHHFLPIVGRAHIAYISSGRVIGLSKMNRIVDYFAKRPQVQERMTKQIVRALQIALKTDDVACVIDAKHLCVNSRGIRDIDSSTVTAEYGGVFQTESVKREFLEFVGMDTPFGV
ncbi:MAG: GTP cyclohydrolase I FolE [Cryomorphaceae bacterium]|nr:GTP cyclohydrolase I FolE [Cryomorphaceae bacterium]